MNLRSSAFPSPARIAALAAVLLMPLAHAADLPVLRLPADALQADARVLRQAYETLHPGLYRYNTRDEMAARFDELDRALDHDQPVTEAFLAFTRFTAAIRCGHSYPNFSNQPRVIAGVLTAGRDRLPFRFVWIDRRMVVTEDFSGDPAVARGTIVEAIDGIATGEILDRMLPLARADGHNDAKRIDQLQVRGIDRYEAFDVYFPLLYPGRGPTFKLTVRSPHGKTSVVEVAGLTHADRLARRPAPNASTNPLGWTIAEVVPGTLLLKMPTWVAYNAKWDWKGFVQQVFERLQADGATRLVIDLRGNEGDDRVGDEIVAHLIATPLVSEGIERKTRYRSVPAMLRPTLDTWDPSFFDWGAQATGPDAEGFYPLAGGDGRSAKSNDDAPDGVVIQPRAPHFTGRVDVLLDAANSSATFGFAKLVQDHRLARLVGAPTGGNLRGIDGGAFFFVRLPNSQIEVDLPLIAQVPVTEMPDRGLLPDVAAMPTADDIAAGTDVALRAALALP
jgi:hypothetical protein